MKKFDVITALGQIRRARQEWTVSQTSFTADVEVLMKRLINEAAVNMMSAEDVARLSGFPVKRIRAMMRANNLNPKNGKRLLAKTAAATLSDNAALLGVEPREFDLMSPLAYLPMGSGLRQLLTASVSGEEVDTGVVDWEDWISRNSYEDEHALIETRVVRVEDLREVLGQVSA